MTDNHESILRSEMSGLRWMMGTGFILLGFLLFVMLGVNRNSLQKTIQKIQTSGYTINSTQVIDYTLTIENKTKYPITGLHIQEYVKGAVIGGVYLDEAENPLKSGATMIYRLKLQPIATSFKMFARKSNGAETDYELVSENGTSLRIAYLDSDFH